MTTSKRDGGSGELAGRRVVVVGLGRSGVAAVRLCQKWGAHVVATDSAPLERLSPAARALDVPLFAGGHNAVDFTAADLIVVSPGVPPLPAWAAAEARGVEVIGELELAVRCVRAPVVCIGGTNGKSTTTTLTGELLRAAHPRVFVGGNLGTPLAEATDEPWDVIVLEVSSFQLERAPTLRPRVSVLLNISEDHLDRYDSFADYAAAKGNAFVNQTADDVAVVFAGDPECLRQAARGGGRVVTFGHEPGVDYRIEGRSVLEVPSGVRFDLQGVALHGRHNLENAAAALATARALGVSEAAIGQGLARFQPLGHRMTFVRELSGVRFYDDSKGTNVGAAVTALLGLAEPQAVLIAGGRDKQGSYAPLVDALVRKGRAAVLIGEAADLIEQAIAGRVPVVRAETMSAAVARAFELALPGDAVLLSPACSSFDMFKSYAERGDRFAEAVRALTARGE